MGCLLDALERGYRVPGLDAAADGDGVFRDLVLARIIEPVSKLDSLRVLEEAGVMLLIPQQTPAHGTRPSFRAEHSAGRPTTSLVSGGGLPQYQQTVMNQPQQSEVGQPSRRCWLWTR